MIITDPHTLIQMKLTNPDEFNWAVEPCEEVEAFETTSGVKPDDPFIRMNCEFIGFLKDCQDDPDNRIDGHLFHGDQEFFALHLFYQPNWPVWSLNELETDEHVRKNPWVAYVTAAKRTEIYLYRRFPTKQELLDYYALYPGITSDHGMFMIYA